MFRSGYRYKYRGVNQEKVFNSLSRKFDIDTLCRDSKTSGSFCVGLAKNKSFEKALNNYNIQIVDKKGFGLLYFVLCLLRRYGVLAATAIGIICMIFLSNFVFNIKIVGTTNVSQEVIAQVLYANGLSRFENKNNINTDTLEKVLSQTLEDVSLVSIITKGNTLVVSVKDKVQNEYENKDNFVAITSEYDGVITSISLVQGTLAKKVGDVIKKGEVLVHPYIVDSSGNQRAVQPKAEIFAKVFLSEKDVFYDVELVTQRTGECQIKQEITLCGLQIFVQNLECSFSQYEAETTKTPITFGNILPLYLEKTVYYETQTFMQNNDFEQKKSQIFEQLGEKVLKNVAECDIIVNERQNITSNAGKNTLEYVLELDKRIC